MAATVAVRPANSARSNDVFGRSRVRRYRVTLDSSYAAGGEAVDLEFIDDPADATVIIEQRQPVDAGYVFVFDEDNEKIVAFWQTDPADTGGANVALVEVDATTDLSGVELNVTVIEA